jgi:hypothetical protein
MPWCEMLDQDHNHPECQCVMPRGRLQPLCRPNSTAEWLPDRVPNSGQCGSIQPLPIHLHGTGLKWLNTGTTLLSLTHTSQIYTRE